MDTKVLENAVNDVVIERAAQDARFGIQNHDPFVYGGILMEELGEFMQAALDTRWPKMGKHGGLDRMRHEAVQMAAVALAIVECLDRGQWTWGGHKEGGIS